MDRGRFCRMPSLPALRSSSVLTRLVSGRPLKCCRCRWDTTACFLDYFISRQRLIEKLHSGQKLIPRDFELFCRTEGGGEASVARFSKKAREDIASILAGGYVMSEASVRVMIYWRKKDSDADTLILLPDLVFRRRE